MKRMNYAELWSDAHVIRAKEEGWELALTVNSGDPITKAFYMIYDISDNKTFKSRMAATIFVRDKANTGSKFHKKAIDACIHTAINNRSRTRK